jgi:hypothetical protein
MSQVGGMLLTMTNAVETLKDLRNATATAATALRGHSTSRVVSEPGPITNEPFSVRVMRVTTSGGPQYAWNAVTEAAAPNLTIRAAEMTRVRFVTKYARNMTAFQPYLIHGQVELRNLLPNPVKLEVGGPGGGRVRAVVAPGTRGSGRRRQWGSGGRQWAAVGEAAGAAAAAALVPCAAVDPAAAMATAVATGSGSTP